MPPRFNPISSAIEMRVLSRRREARADSHLALQAVRLARLKREIDVTALLDTLERPSMTPRVHRAYTLRKSMLPQRAPKPVERRARRTLLRSIAPIARTPILQTTRLAFSSVLSARSSHRGARVRCA